MSVVFVTMMPRIQKLSEHLQACTVSGQELVADAWETGWKKGRVLTRTALLMSIYSLGPYYWRPALPEGQGLSLM